MFNIGQVELWGTHMEGEQASFDKIELRDLKARDNEDNTDFTIGTVSLVKPSPALAAGIAKAFSGDENALDGIEGDIGFQAVSFADMNVVSDDANVTLKSMSMGEAKDKTGQFNLAGLSMDAKGDEKVKISLGSINVSGANVQKYKGLFTEAIKGGDGAQAGEAAIADIMSSMNIYDPDFQGYQP